MNIIASASLQSWVKREPIRPTEQTLQVKLQNMAYLAKAAKVSSDVVEPSSCVPVLNTSTSFEARFLRSNLAE